MRNLFSKLEVAFALAVTARSKPDTRCNCHSKHPPSLSLSVALTLPATLFVCGSRDSSFLMLYFSLVLSLYLSESCSLSISLSRKLVLSLTQSSTNTHMQTNTHASTHRLTKTNLHTKKNLYSPSFPWDRYNSHNSHCHYTCNTEA